MKRSGTILLVEDDPNDVALTQLAFERVGLLNPLDVVGDGEQAIAYLAGQPPYAERDGLPILVLLDLKLPRRSGFDVLAWMRSMPGVRRLPVVILTSSAQLLDINRAYDAGANSYLVKPVPFEGLLRLVEALGLYWLSTNEGPLITGATP
jgi:CheY-like chemotaxis protein